MIYIRFAGMLQSVTSDDPDLIGKEVTIIDEGTGMDNNTLTFPENHYRVDCEIRKLRITRKNFTIGNDKEVGY